MEIQLLSFGKIAEIITVKHVNIEGISDTDGLKSHLEAQFPELKNVKYKLAVNKLIVQSNTSLTHHATVAIMPPFSGG
ncbi:molybdopterin synthase sulfur carrier subunit [Pedobacter yonginense]|uniref:Molybdopterin synthase sulfur carrier subunit n=1 Tax=Pedobacter yonginense TaxID=651869 RepID=A0A317EL67_9SPHI|nr:MoaD/ThiS family protein [Pedobacter yonginense]PWS26026.1 molybdopterin synthase sulfur carrier subunit [Pedobacter yonginense]